MSGLTNTTIFLNDP